MTSESGDTSFEDTDAATLHMARQAIAALARQADALAPASGRGFRDRLGWSRGQLVPPVSAAKRLSDFEQRMLAAYHGFRPLLGSSYPFEFRHKIWMRRLHDRRPVLRDLVDKLVVRDFVSSRVGDDFHVDVLDVVESAADITPDAYPATFAVRSAHGSGGVILVRDAPGGDLSDVDVWWRAAYRVGDVPWDDVRRRFDRVLSLDYGVEQLEWAYVGLPRRLVVEELLVGPHGGQPDEYLFVCFDGEPAFANVVSGRFEHQSLVCRTPDWRPVMSGARYPAPPVPPQRPAQWEHMLELTRELSRGFDMVRVDLYVTDRGVRVGEMTLYPAAGLGGFDPPVDDFIRGALWTLPSLQEMRSPYA